MQCTKRCIWDRRTGDCWRLLVGDPGSGDLICILRNRCTSVGCPVNFGPYTAPMVLPAPPLSAFREEMPCHPQLPIARMQENESS